MLRLIFVTISLISFPLLAAEIPKCQVDPKAAIDRTGNAGCLIKYEGKMLVTRDLNKKKLSPPGGAPHVKLEPAQCTAHYQTWDETGIEVVVGKLLHDFNGRFLLFACTPVNTLHSGLTNIVVPHTGRDEIREIFFVDPGKVTTDEWRFPDQLAPIQAAFEK